MESIKKYKNEKNDYQIILGDTLDKLQAIKDETVDLVIADPPYFKVIKKINSLYESGNKILIFTARYMGKNNNDVDLAIKEGFESTELQLKEWGLNYNELIFGKPVYDVFIDDKNFEFKKDWLKNFNNKY